MGKDSHEFNDHDMWLLSEEYHYYDYIASDMALKKLRWDVGNQLIYSDDIDEELTKFLKEYMAKINLSDLILHFLIKKVP